MAVFTGMFFMVREEPKPIASDDPKLSASMHSSGRYFSISCFTSIDHMTPEEIMLATDETSYLPGFSSNSLSIGLAKASPTIAIYSTPRRSTVDHNSLGLSEAQATEVVKTMGVLLIGATQSDQAPSLDDEDLPQDVQNLIASFSSKPLFIKNAVRIIEAIRMENVSGI